MKDDIYGMSIIKDKRAEIIFRRIRNDDNELVIPINRKIKLFVKKLIKQINKLNK
jgi:hypothetical protein